METKKSTASDNDNSMMALLAATAGAVVGVVATTLFFRARASSVIEPRRRRIRLPKLVVLVRHGQSEGNADLTLYRTMPDNLVGLTDLGRQQAERVGQRVEEIFQNSPTRIRRVHVVVSPFARTLQTATLMRSFFEHRIVRTDIQPRIREQEFGNLQGDDFRRFRNEQTRVGRFWYRFPTGESGADVYDRVKSWWTEAVLAANERVGYDPIDAVVVVTHGLTMRFVLMQLYGWSPTTFHSVWNAGNCDLYLLKKDLSKPGHSPYVLDKENGDAPMSSVNLRVSYQLNDGPIETNDFSVENYLEIEPPRTKQHKLLTEALKEQHSLLRQSGCTIVSTTIIPFVEGGEELNETATIAEREEAFFKVEARKACYPKPEQS